MKLYITMDTYSFNKLNIPIDTPLLFSFLKIKINEKMLQYSDIIIDSGVATLRRGVSHEKFLSIVEEYKNFIETKHFNLFVELDLYSHYKKEYIESVRKELEKTGKKIIPVWHKETGEEYFYELCRKYDYIGFGGTRFLPNNLALKLTQYAYEHKIKTHYFGTLSSKKLMLLPVYSADATSWMSVSVFGSIPNMTIKGIKNSKKIIRKENKIINLNNSLLEYRKLQNFLTEYWRKKGVVYD